MNAVFDRKMEQFQHRVQQKINLADDEIQRLSAHLTRMKTDILDTKDELSRAKTKATQVTQELSGRTKTTQAHTDTVIAKLRAEHHMAMQELQERQSQEIGGIHQKFDDALAALEQLSVQKIARRTSALDEQLASAERQFGSLREASGRPAQAPAPDARQDTESLQRLGAEREERLEALIQARNQERLDSLLQAKSRLSDCVGTLEEMERNHATRMATFKSRLDAMDAAHGDKQRREEERQARAAGGLRRRQGELEKRARSIQKTIARLERHHAAQVAAALREGQQLQGGVAAAAARGQAAAEQGAKLQQWQARCAQARARLAQREGELAQARADNEAAKREVARLQHEARAPRRV
jgi:chromosome segregation ATPase